MPPQREREREKLCLFVCQRACAFADLWRPEVHLFVWWAAIWFKVRIWGQDSVWWLRVELADNATSRFHSRAVMIISSSVLKSLNSVSICHSFEICTATAAAELHWRSATPDQCLKVSHMIYLETCTTVRLPLGEMGYVERWVLMYRKLGGEIKQAPVARRIETCWYLEWVLSVHIAIYWIFVAGIEVLDIVVGICC